MHGVGEADIRRKTLLFLKSWESNSMKISRWPMGLLFVAMLAMVATDVMAQRGGEGGRGGGRPGGGGTRGGGGFGGGFGGGSMSGRGGGGLAGLLQMKEVREEIELMPDQEAALKKISEDRPRMQFPEGINRGDRSEENQKKISEWVAKMTKQRAEAAEKLHGQLEEILLPDQLERLEQLEVQQMRTGALTNKRVVAALKLTTKQQEDLKKTSETAREGMREKMVEIFRGGGGDRDAMRKKMEAASKEVEDKMMSVLTSDQKQEFAELKGKAFEFPRPERRGGAGGGQRGGRGGEDGGGRGRRGGRGGGRPAAE